MKKFKCPKCGHKFFTAIDRPVCGGEDCKRAEMVEVKGINLCDNCMNNLAVAFNVEPIGPLSFFKCGNCGKSISYGKNCEITPKKVTAK